MKRPIRYGTSGEVYINATVGDVGSRGNVRHTPAEKTSLYSLRMPPRVRTVNDSKCLSLHPLNGILSALHTSAWMA